MIIVTLFFVLISIFLFCAFIIVAFHYGSIKPYDKNDTISWEGKTTILPEKNEDNNWNDWSECPTCGVDKYQERYSKDGDKQKRKCEIKPCYAYELKDVEWEEKDGEKVLSEKTEVLCLAGEGQCYDKSEIKK